MITIDRSPVVTRLIVVSIIVVLLTTLCIMGNRSGGTERIHTNETTSTINSTNEDSTRININTASKAALETLPGIGATLAEKIIENRPYASPWDLMNVEGIGENTVRGLLDCIEV